MVHVFESRPVAAELIDRLLDVARRGASAGFSQGTDFLGSTIRSRWVGSGSSLRTHDSPESPASSRPRHPSSSSPSPTLAATSSGIPDRTRSPSTSTVPRPAGQVLGHQHGDGVHAAAPRGRRCRTGWLVLRHPLRRGGTSTMASHSGQSQCDRGSRSRERRHRRVAARLGEFADSTSTRRDGPPQPLVTRR